MSGSLGVRLECRLARRGAEIGSLTDAALRDGFRTIAAAGGDGTIAAVASRLVDSDSRLGILPLGTFNYVARNLGIPAELPDAVRVLVEGRERTIDVGDVNGRIFLNNASLGAYVAILAQREREYRRWGRSRIAAYWSVLRALANLRGALSLRISMNGAVWRYRSPAVFVAGNAYQLREFGLKGGECIAERRLAMYVAPESDRIGLLRLAIGLALRRLRPERDFELRCGDDIVVETAHRSRHVAHDGERERMASPFRFRLRRDALRVLVQADSR